MVRNLLNPDRLSGALREQNSNQMSDGRSYFRREGEMNILFDKAQVSDLGAQLLEIFRCVFDQTLGH